MGLLRWIKRLVHGPPVRVDVGPGDTFDYEAAVGPMVATCGHCGYTSDVREELRELVESGQSGCVECEACGNVLFWVGED